MKTMMLVLIVLACLPLCAHTNEVSPARLRAAERLLDTMRTDDQLQRIVAKIVADQTNNSTVGQQAADIITAFFTKYINYSNLRPRLAELYAATFRDDELLALTQFYQSPLGRRYSDVSLGLHEQLMEVIRHATLEHVDELHVQLQQRMADLAKEERARAKDAARRAPPVVRRKIGDPAPPLAVTQWVKGAAINLADGRGSNIYVIEFWATWCGPCRRTIPHLTTLQRAFRDKGVVVIGISDEDAATVVPFVESKGTNMDYAVALDRDNETSHNYMRAFDIAGIPHAFVVDTNGLIVWHGHPLDGLDRVLERLIAGTFDPSEPEKLARARELFAAYQRVAQLADEHELLQQMGARMLALGGHDPNFLNHVAWSILTDEMAWRDYALAELMAARAVELTNHKDVDVLDTYARALAVNGKQDEAIAIQEKAIAQCTNKEERKALRRHLRQIKAGKFRRQ